MDYVVKLNKIITNFEKNDVWVLLDLHQVGGVPEMLCFFILLPPPPPPPLFGPLDRLLKHGMDREDCIGKF